MYKNHTIAPSSLKDFRFLQQAFCYTATLYKAEPIADYIPFQSQSKWNPI